MTLHQTQLDISPFVTGSEDGDFDSDEEPTVIPPTPLKERGKTSSASRNLFRSTEESVDLANELPQWMTSSTTATPRTGAHLPKATTPSSIGDKNLLQEILKEVRSSNDRVGERLEQLERQVKDLQDDETTPTLKKKAPSPEVREMVRKVYKALYEEDENFGWETSKSFGHSKNVDILRRLASEVKNQLPETSTVTIKAAARTYFCSVSGTQRLKLTGKYSDKCVKQKRRNRIMRKLKRRKVALAKTASLTAERKTM